MKKTKYTEIKLKIKITSEITKGYYVEVLTPKMMKLLESPKSKIFRMETIKMCFI